MNKDTAPDRRLKPLYKSLILFNDFYFLFRENQSYKKWIGMCCQRSKRKFHFLCVYKSTDIKRKEKRKEKYRWIYWWVGKDQSVHKGPNDLEDMTTLGHKWLAGNGVAMGTTAIRQDYSDVDNYLSNRNHKFSWTGIVTENLKSHQTAALWVNVTNNCLYFNH